MILYKVHQSPFEHQALSQCIDRLTSDDGLLLVQSACYAAGNTNALSEKLSKVNNLYVLSDDLLARGIECQLKNCQPIDYNRMVELCLEYDQVISW